MESATATFKAHLQRKLVLSSDEAAALSKELIERFLPIKRYLKDFDACICYPSPQLDAAWHQLILFTKLYASLCGKSFIHHNPLGELDSVIVKAQRYKRTLAAYEELFGAPPKDLNIWPAVYSGSVVTDDDEDDKDVDDKDEHTPSTSNKKQKIAEQSQKESHEPVESEDPQQTSASAIIPTNPPSTKRLNIYVRNEHGECTCFNVTTKVAMSKIFDTMAQRLNVESSQLTLTLEGKQLQRDETLAESGLEDGAMVDVAARGPSVDSAKLTILVYFVHLKDWLSLIVTPQTTIDNMKRMIQDVKGIPASSLRLIFNGEAMWSGTLALHEVEDGDEIDVILEQKGC